MLTENELMEISERIGEAVHNAWMEKRRKEKGWHSPEECTIITVQCIKYWSCRCGSDPIKENGFLKCSDCGEMREVTECYYCSNCHPCMRPYKDLPDSEKELDRQYPALFLKILSEIGYKIEKA